MNMCIYMQIYVYMNIYIYIHTYIHTWCVDIYGVNHLRLREKSLLVQAPTRYPNHTWKIPFFLGTSTDIHRRRGFLWFSSGFSMFFPWNLHQMCLKLPCPTPQKNWAVQAKQEKRRQRRGRSVRDRHRCEKTRGENTGSWETWLP